MNADIRLKGAPNFRDLGGYATADGRHVKRGLLFRSEGLNTLTTEDYAALHDLGIRLVCDLRSDLERSLKPTVWPEHMLPTTLIMDVNADIRAGDGGLYDMLRSDPTERGALALILHIYKWVPDALSRHLAKFFNAIAEDNGLPLILHCTAGKDRTGVLSAVLLLALGVPRETVVVDYMKTNEYRDAVKLEKKVHDLMEPILGGPPSREIVEMMAGVHPTYLEASLTTIDSNYDSLNAYLESAGVSQAVLAKLRERLLD